MTPMGNGGDLERTDRRLHALSETMRAFAEATTDYARLLEIVAERMACLTGDGCILALMSEDETNLLPGAVYFHDPEAMAVAKRLLGAKPVPVEGPLRGPRVARTHKGVFMPRVDLPPLSSDLVPEYAAVLRELGVRSLLSVPLEIHGRALGVVSMVRLTTGGAPFNDEDEAVARNLAGHAALAISNARLLNSVQFELKERTRAEEEASRFVALIQHCSDFIAMAELDGRVLFVNEGGRRLVGLDLDADVTLQTLADFHTEEGMKRAAVLREHGRWQGEGQLRHFKTGELIDMQVSSFLVRSATGQPFGFATVQRDMSESKRLELHLRQVQRMEAVGRLAGGVAHDFNNMLSIILSYSSMLLGDLSIKESARADIAEIHVAGERAATLTKQLLAFSRQQVLELRVVDLNEILAGIEKMVNRILGEDVQLRTLPHEGLGRVKVDVGQIEQVVLNLTVNARDAMPNGGVLTLATANVDPGDDPNVSDPPGARRCVRFTVTDTGTGMDEATRQRIFEPFFTTKEKGKGTGLGLSTVFGIVEQSGGRISVRSAPLRGTTFEIDLPRCDEPVSTDAPSRPVLDPRAPGAETILLVEDEAQVRKLMYGVLSRGGYHVIEAADSDDALRESAAYPGEIHLLLTDVVMPKLNGRQLADRVSAERPNVKVLYVSGYTEDTIGLHGVLEAGVMLLAKPLTPDLLLQRVRDVFELSSRSSRPPIP